MRQHKQARLDVKSKIENISIINDRVMGLLDEAGVARDWKYDILTAIDEAFSNIVFHGYKGREDGLIEISITMENNVFQITFTDGAESFSPPACNPVLGRALLDKKNCLGVGIYIMQQLMDKVTYERIGQTNHLTLIKTITGEVQHEPESE